MLFAICNNIWSVLQADGARGGETKIDCGLAAASSTLSFWQ
jgi:hypothetical protein